MTLLAYRYALNPTPAQDRALRSHAGAARVAFNWGLARVKASMSQREAESEEAIRIWDAATWRTRTIVTHSLGGRLVDRYLEFVAGRCRPNTLWSARAEKRGLQFPGMRRVCGRAGRPDYAVLVSGKEPADG